MYHTDCILVNEGDKGCVYVWVFVCLVNLNTLYSSQHTLRWLSMWNLLPFLHANVTLSRLWTLKNQRQILACPLGLCWTRYGKLCCGVIRRDGRGTGSQIKHTIWKHWCHFSRSDPQVCLDYRSQRQLAVIALENIFSNIWVARTLSLRSPCRCLRPSSSSTLCLQ